MTTRTDLQRDYGRAAGRAADGEHAVECGEPLVQAAQSSAAGGVGTAAPVVGDADPERFASMADLDPDPGGVRVLGDVGQQLADGEVGRRLHRRRHPGRQHAVHLGGLRQVQGQRAYRTLIPLVLGGFVIAAPGALLPATRAARTGTATALRTE
jgi:hypothetical protein